MAWPRQRRNGSREKQIEAGWLVEVEENRFADGRGVRTKAERV